MPISRGKNTTLEFQPRYEAEELSQCRHKAASKIFQAQQRASLSLPESGMMRAVLFRAADGHDGKVIRFRRPIQEPSPFIQAEIYDFVCW
jgi:hypothetical protein